MISMHQARSTLETKLLISFALAVLVILILGALTWIYSLRGAEATRAVIQSHEMIAGLDRLQIQLYEAESAQRAFLLRKEPVFRRDCEIAVKKMTAELSALKKMAVDNPQQNKRMDELSTAINQRTMLFARKMLLRERDDMPAILQTMFDGRQIDQRIQNIIAVISAHELQRLSQTERMVSSRATATAAGFIGLIAFLLISMPLFFLRFHRSIKDKIAADARASELVSVIDSTPDLIAMSTPDGHLSYLNQAARDALKLGQNPANTFNYRDFYPPSALKTIEDIAMPTALEKGFWAGDIAMLCADGEEIPVSQMLICHRQQDGAQSVSMIARDISERKQAEKLLAESARYDVSSATALALFNAGSNRERVLQGIFTLLDTDHDFSASAFYSWHEASGSLQFNQRHRARDDLPPFFKLGEGMVGTAGATRTLMQTATGGPDACWLCHGIATCRVPPAAVLFCPVTFRGELLGVMVLAAATAPNTQDIAFLNHLGAHLGAALHNIKQLEELKILAIELQIRNEDVAQKNKEVEQASQMKNEFLATMSHELRTPLNAIIGFSSVIRDGLSGQISLSTRDCAQDIFASGQHLLALINDILDLSTIESGHMKLALDMIDGETLAASGMSVLRERASTHQIRLSQSVEPTLNAMYIDPRKTRQIIFNLLSNAVKFTPDGGLVSLSLRRVARAKINLQQRGPNCRLFPLQVSLHEEFLEICVTDSGIGINPADLKKLFAPFTQADASRNRHYEGTGLGLMMIRRLTELQGGAISVYSVPDQGSSFTVWLPLREVASVCTGKGTLNATETVPCTQ